MTKQPDVVLKLSTFSAMTLMCLCSWSVGAGGWVSHVTCRCRGGYACSLGCDTTSYPSGKGQVSLLTATRVVPADLPDPPAVDITKFGWNKKKGEKEGEEVIMPVLDASAIAPPALLDIISCSWVNAMYNHKV